MESFLVRLALLSDIIKFFGGIESKIGIAAFNELHGILMIHGFALTLFIRTKGAANMRTFVENDSAPAETINNVFFSTFHKACLISIFDA